MIQTTFSYNYQAKPALSSSSFPHAYALCMKIVPWAVFVNFKPIFDNWTMDCWELFPFSPSLIVVEIVIEHLISTAGLMILPK